MIENLPFEIFEKIVKLLPIKEIDECRFVNKKWFNAIDLIDFDCLIVYNDCPPINVKHPFSDELVDCRYSINNYHTSTTEFKKRIYRKFKRIYFQSQYGIGSEASSRIFHGGFRNYGEYNRKKISSTEGLNHLKQLKELKLGEVWIDKDYELNLPNLETFQIRDTFRHVKAERLRFKLILNVPNLTRLSVRTMDHLKFTSKTDSVKYLKACCVLRSMNEFKSLEYLYLTNLSVCYKYGYYDCVFNDKLKELHIFSVDKTSIDGLQAFNFLMSNLRELRSKQKRTKVYYLGVDLDHFIDQKLNPYKTFIYKLHLEKNCNYLGRESLDFYLKNYSVVSPTLPTIYAINYSEIEQDLDRMPEDFYQKLIQVKGFQVDGLAKDEDKLGKFLKKFKRLTYIDFETELLSKNFYSNILPSSVPYLESICFLKRDPLACKLDLNFLFKFKNLIKVSIYSNYLIDLNLVQRLFENLDYFNEFNLSRKLGRETIVDRKPKFTIQKSRYANYFLLLCGDFVNRHDDFGSRYDVFVSLLSLLEHLEELNDKGNYFIKSQGN